MSREYICAGKAVEAVIFHKKSFKYYCANTKIGKTDFALAAETLKYASALKTIFNTLDLSGNSLDINPGIMYVMAYELLFGRKKIKGGGAVKRAITNHLPDLQRTADELLKKSGGTSFSDLIPEGISQAQLLPKYVRVNYIKISLPKALAAVQEFCPAAVVDQHIPSLIVLPAKTAGIGEYPLVKSGHLIIQDKASCMPSQVLFDAWTGGDIIDACAAPGNKTSHVASQLHNSQSPLAKKAKVYAFDKSKERSELLRSRMAAAGADSIVTVTNGDFLSLDLNAAPYNGVTSILLDPSCSGSGVVRALDRVIEKKGNDDGRLAHLRAFQLSAVLHAMSSPHVRLIVYSTCSIHQEENESVVAEALAASASRGDNWTLQAPSGLSQWSRRGEPYEGLSVEQQACLIRCLPEDGLNGFFVSLFVRASSVEQRVASTPEQEVVVPPAAAANKKREAIDDDDEDSLHHSCHFKRLKLWKPLHKEFCL